MRASSVMPGYVPSGNVTPATTTYTVLPSDFMIVCDASGGAFTVTLPAVASSRSKHVVVKKAEASANAVTIQGNAAELIEAANTFVQATAAGISTHLYCDGTKWYIVGHNH